MEQENGIKKYIREKPLRIVSVFSFFSLIIGAAGGYFLFYNNFFLPTRDVARSLRLNQSNFPLINPLLLCNPEPKKLNQDRVMKDRIEEFVDERTSDGLAENISVYLINYKSGRWVGVNENDRYDPASMLKLPVMIAYYKTAETNPGILSEKTSFRGDTQNDGEYFKSLNSIIAGKDYTIESLIESMIVNSDNTASALLEKYINPDSLHEVYTDLHLPLPTTAPNVEYLSAKLYVFFFRVLYNATYLTDQSSEKALELLTHAEMSPLRKGISDKVTIAEKFGERSIFDEAGNLQDRELHDCGIIYKKDNPYLLCVMSRGKNFDELAKNISDLSKLVYENIDK